MSSLNFSCLDDIGILLLACSCADDDVTLAPPPKAVEAVDMW